MSGVAPGTFRIPVPGGHAEFGIVAIGDGAPASGERFLHDVRSVNAVDVAVGEDVEGGAESGVGVEGIDLVGGSDVDMDGGVGGGLGTGWSGGEGEPEEWKGESLGGHVVPP